jgi:hypothetical protein
VNALYSVGPFVTSLLHALAEDGILVAQVGEAPNIRSPSGDFSVDRNRLGFIDALVTLGFQSIRDYEESHNGFTRPWEFIVAFKQRSSRAEWYANSALINTKMHQRGLRTTTGSSPFLYFDGSTMKSYTHPSKGSEVAFCRHLPNAKECVNGHGFDPYWQNVPLSALEVKSSDTGPTVLVRQDIYQNSYIGLNKLVPAIYTSSKTTELITGWWNHLHWMNSDYIHGMLDIFSPDYGLYTLYNVSSCLLNSNSIYV